MHLACDHVIELLVEDDSHKDIGHDLLSRGSIVEYLPTGMREAEFGQSATEVRLVLAQKGRGIYEPSL